MYAKCIQKFVEMWDTFCILPFCIHFVYINSDVQKVYIMYTICIQNSYRMCIQIIVCRIRPWHVARAIACTRAITCANQGKGGLAG